MIAGTKSGHLLIFDIASAEIIQEIEDAHEGEIWQIKKHKVLDLIRARQIVLKTIFHYLICRNELTGFYISVYHDKSANTDFD